ncbi:magnesium/cobalt transporter CorA [Bacillus glycinifermentans]|uniref:magnesium/cobalt transporter CorA n=1 Tax=Bacillus glycinifermentans TaxID=1664069 RepID=UPI001FF3A6E9|nr:magnesium/cobalt transporter CorA [Bacillus glycinifermentans]MEC3609557.1 magnesium/cobalt transporter CorA [Bacillus glycinifermentans]UOY88213.1 magnesium/cobalt transporter CorA [Bacillus glycinifermentans]
MFTHTAITKDGRLLSGISTERLADQDIEWYWTDFDQPTEEEASLLKDHFHFHPLSIEDCFHYLQRPKLDQYEEYLFFVIHALNQKTLASEEVDLFVGKNYVVSFHFHQSTGIEKVRKRFLENKALWKKGPNHIAYMIMDQLVDEYFPILYQIEDRLNEIAESDNRKTFGTLMNEVFDIRSDLLKLRRTIIPMRDLLYRILNIEHLKDHRERKAYYNDIYDHLLKLTEIVENNRDMTADLRDSYQTLNSNRMNAIMMTLTIVSTIFIPLTFIVGVYGMNFDNMPELHWRYGYFIVLGVMAAVVAGMIIWFRHKGWFDIFK